MKTVFDYFAEHYTVISSAPEVPQSIREGIAAYLGSIGLGLDGADEGVNKKIARRELMRFKLMPQSTFAAFFENFELREQINRVSKECKLMAINRAVSGKTVDEAACKVKMVALYDSATPLSSDRRYKGWLDETTVEIAACLKFAAGVSDAVPDSVAEALGYR